MRRSKDILVPAAPGMEYTASVTSSNPSGDRATGAPRWMEELERARQRLERAVFLLVHEERPPIDLTGTGVALSAALTAVYDAYDLRCDRLDGARLASTSIDEARHQIGVDNDVASVTNACDELAKARGHLAEVETLLASRPIESPAKPELDLLASIDRPLQHGLARPSLVPTLHFAAGPESPEPPRPKLERAKSFEELQVVVAALEARAAARREKPQTTDEAPPPEAPVEQSPPPLGFSSDVPDRVTELTFIEARTRELLEEVAMVGLQRAPLPGDPWRVALALEQRMFRAVDAIGAMDGASLACVERWAADAPTKDPTRVFAVAFTMGCFRGRDALAVAERVFSDFELVEPSSGRALALALKLVPHELLPVMLRSMLADTDARHRAVAIEVLGHRGLAAEHELAHASLDVASVAAHALPHLALMAPRSARDGVAQAASSGEAELRAAGRLAMVLGDLPSATETLRGALDGEQAAHAAILLALCGDDRDAAALLDRSRAAPTTALIHAIGWAGSVASLPILMDWVEHDDEALAMAAAVSLERITGAALTENARVDDDDVFVPEPPEPNVGEPQPERVVRMTSDPRDLPPEPAPETAERPSTDPSRWRAWWKERARDYSPTKRYRAGRLYTPRVSLWEVDACRRTPAERRLLQYELVIRTGNHVRLDPQDLVAVQEAALEQWRPIAERASSQPGSWHRVSRAR